MTRSTANARRKRPTHCARNYCRGVMLAEFRPLDGAVCATAEWWPWPERTPPESPLWDVAVDVCRLCPARIPCARLALANHYGSPAGVWAGLVLGNGRAHRAELRRIAADAD